MPRLRPNPDGPPALELTWGDAHNLCVALLNALDPDGKDENILNIELPSDNEGLSLMWREWPFSININC